VVAAYSHLMHTGGWMFTQLGGLDTVSNASSSGWRHVLVAPDVHAVTRLREGGATLNTSFGRTSGAASVASFEAAVLTEIYLCNVCSCQEILRRNGRGQCAGPGMPPCTSCGST
jgi:hypothetical protein